MNTAKMLSLLRFRVPFNLPDGRWMKIIDTMNAGPPGPSPPGREPLKVCNSLDMGPPGLGPPGAGPPRTGPPGISSYEKKTVKTYKITFNKMEQVMKNTTAVLLRGLSVFLLFVSSVALALPTKSGTNITNVVTVNYNDANSHGYTGSATVTVIVADKPGVTLTNTGSAAKTSPGNETGASAVTFFAYATNTGNFAEAYDVSASVPSGWAYRIVTDINKNGVASDGENLAVQNDGTTPSLDPYGTPTADYFIVAVDVPLSAAEGDYTITVDAAKTTGSSHPATTSNTLTYTVHVKRPVIVAVPQTISPAVPNIEYTKHIKYTNTGTAAALNVTITDPIPAGLTSPNTISDGGTNTAGTISWPSTTIAAGASVDYTYKVTVAAGLSNTTITNTASAAYSSTLSTGSTRSETAVTTTVTFTVPTTGWSMQIEKLTGGTLAASASQTVLVGNKAVYHIVLTNNGTVADQAAFDIQVAHTNALGGTWEYSLSSDLSSPFALPHSTGSVAASGTYSLYAGVTIGGTQVNGTSDDVTYKATPSTGGTNPTVTSHTVAGTPVLAITKSADKMTPIPGDVITYHVTCTNNGAFAASAVVFTDPFAAQLTYTANSCEVKAPGAGSFTAMNDVATSGIFTNNTTSGGINLTVSTLNATETVEFTYTATVK